MNECTKQLNEVKLQMRKQTGVAYKGSQRKALTILKRRKMYENQLNNLMNQQFNVDQVQFTSETIQTTIDTVLFHVTHRLERSSKPRLPRRTL